MTRRIHPRTLAALARRFACLFAWLAVALPLAAAAASRVTWVVPLLGKRVAVHHPGFGCRIE